MFAREIRNTPKEGKGLTNTGTLRHATPATPRPEPQQCLLQRTPEIGGIDNRTETRSHTASLATRYLTDFSSIPVYGLDQTDRRQQPAFGPLGVIQPKQAVGSADDSLEHDADRAAHFVLRMPDPPRGANPPVANRRVPALQHSQTAMPLRAPDNLAHTSATKTPHIASHELRQPGRSLDGATRDFFEPRFGQDFSHVRVHADERAAVSARAINARAYTVGRNIVFGGGEYAPHSNAGRELLAHELAHVVQQTGRADTRDETLDRRPVLASGLPEATIQRAPAGAGTGTGTGNTPTQQADPAAAAHSAARELDGGHIYFDTTAELWGGGAKLDSVAFQAGVEETRFSKALADFPGSPTSGFVRLVVNAQWHFEEKAASVLPLIEHDGNGRLVIDTPFRAKAAGDTAFSVKQSRLAEQASSGTGASLDPQPQAVSDSDELGMSVIASPRVTYQQQSAAQGGLSAGVVSGQIQTQTADVQAYGTSFAIDLLAGKASPKPNPQPAPSKQLRRFAMTTEFGVNQRTASASELALLAMWWNGQAGLTPLPNDEARDAVRLGQTEVFVLGHASSTGSREYNLVLAKDRADGVKARLAGADLMGPAASISSSSTGFDDARVHGEAQTERYVATVFEAMVTEGQPPAATTSVDKDGDTAS